MIMKTLMIAFVTSLISSFSLYLNADPVIPGALKAGAAKAEISPTPDMFPMGNYIGLHDPLFVRAVVLDNGSVKAALVTFDLGSVPRGNEMVDLVCDELGIEPEHLLITGTHNHSAPRISRSRYMQRAEDEEVTNPYYELVKTATMKAIREADENLQPARVGFAEGKAYVNTNRDEKIGEGYHMGYNPEGPSDKTVAVVSFYSLEGDPIAVYANYPVHAVVMFRATTREGMPEVTADLPGATSRYVEDHFENAVALWTSGAAGDQNPLFMANYNQDHPDVYDEGAAGYAILDVQARRLGEEIVRLTRSIKNTSGEVIIWGKQTTVTCPGRKRETPPEPGTPRGGYQAPVNVKMVDGDPVTIPLYLFMINDIALAGVSGEVFTEIGVHLKEQSIFDRTVMVTHTPNGIGYIPTDAAYLMPSEKALTSRIKPGYAEPAIIGALTGLMGEYLAELE
jgi:hypothetical protein